MVIIHRPCGCALVPEKWLSKQMVPSDPCGLPDVADMLTLGAPNCHVDRGATKGIFTRLHTQGSVCSSPRAMYWVPANAKHPRSSLALLPDLLLASTTSGQTVGCLPTSNSCPHQLISLCHHSDFDSRSLGGSQGFPPVGCFLLLPSLCPALRHLKERLMFPSVHVPRESAPAAFPSWAASLPHSDQIWRFLLPQTARPRHQEPVRTGSVCTGLRRGAFTRVTEASSRQQIKVAPKF